MKQIITSILFHTGKQEIMNQVLLRAIWNV